MPEHVVVMPAIRCADYSGSVPRANLDYVRYSAATWSWWCRHNGVHFVLLQEPQEDPELQRLPPTLQRWLALDRLFEAFGEDATLAFVDADTMIRWDAPDIFHLAGASLTAVRDWHASWIHNSLKAFQPFFPDVHVDWWNYFNAGVLICNAAHRPVFHALLTFALENRSVLDPIFRSWQVGDDQTPLNFLATRHGHTMNFLDARFNMIHCVPITQELMWLETHGTTPTVPEDTILDLPLSQLDFVEMGYIWHFTNVVRTKSLVMAKTWEYISAAYPEDSGWESSSTQV